MTKIDIDTGKVRDSARDLMFSAQNYKNTIDSLYDDTLKRMPENRVWYGQSANGYVNETQRQKTNLEGHANDSIVLSKVLIEYLDTLENIAKINVIK